MASEHDPKGGTVATYQGFVCVDVSYTNALGVDPDASMVTIRVPNVATLKDVPGEEPLVPDLVALLRGTASATLLGGSELRETGTLALAQETNGYLRTFTAEGLHVVNASRANVLGKQTWGDVTLSLVDDRGLYDRGLLDRWDFLRADAAGPAAERDLDPATRKPLTLAGVARYLVSQLYRSPKLTRYPKRWDTQPGRLSVDPGTTPREALREFLEQYRARFSLNPDRTVSIWGEGEARSPDQILTISGAPLTPEIVEDRGGQGHRGGKAFRRPPRFAVVVGGERIRTVEVELEPVVMVDGTPVPLSEGLEELRQRLTGDARRREQARQAEAAAAASGTAAAIAARGGRPGAVGVTPLPGTAAVAAGLGVGVGPGGVGGIPGGSNGAPTPPPRTELHPAALAYVQRAALRPSMFAGREGEFYVQLRNAYMLWRVKGAETTNRHLLPVLNRAERRPGTDTRLPPELRASSYRKMSGRVRLNLETGRVTSVSPERLASEERAAQLRAEAAYSLAIERLNKRVIAAGIATSFDYSIGVEDAIEVSQATSDAVAGVSHVLAKLAAESPEEVGRARDLMRGAVALRAYEDKCATLKDEGEANPSANEVAVARQQGDATADASDVIAGYLSARAALAAADLSLVLPSEIDVAAVLVKVGAAAREGGGFPTTLVNGIRTSTHPELDAAVRLIVTKLRAISQRAQLTPDEIVAGLIPEEVYYSNEPEGPVDFVLVDAQLGLFRSRVPLGHLDRTDVRTVAGCQLVPKRVLARYGVLEELARADPSQGQTFQSQAQAAGTPRAVGDPAGSQLAKRFVRAYRVESGAASEVALSAVLKDDCTSLRRPDIGPELIELDGKTNEAALEAKAEAAALEALNVEPLTESRALTFLGPQNVPLDGLIASVEISGRPGNKHNMLGFRTVVTVGRGVKPTATPTTTRSRVGGDAAGQGINAPATSPGAR